MPARRTLTLFIMSIAAALVAGCGDDDGAGAKPAPPPTVQLALDFTPNAVHAPIFAAVRTGADRRDGVKLVIRQPGSGPDSLKLVAAGKLDLGVLDIQDLAIAQARGIDVVAVGELVSRPLSAIVARANIKRPRDLEGQDVGVSGLPSDPAFLNAIISHDGGRMSRVHLVTIGFNAVSGILAGKIAAAPVFWNAEGVALKHQGVKVNEFRIERYGAPAFPEVVLVTSRKTLAAHRDRIVRTLHALRDGIAAVRKDPQAATAEIAREAQTDDTGLIGEQLAAVSPIFATDLRLHRSILERWADFDVELGVVKHRPDVDRAFDFSVLG